MLANSDAQAAADLWGQLVDAARLTRLGTGTLTLSSLVAKLRTGYALKDHPDYASDWQTLLAITTDYKSRIQERLPNGAALSRKSEVAKLTTLIRENRGVVVLGDSGTGKSALVKTTLDGNFSDVRQVWFGPEDLKVALSEAKRRNLPLLHPLGQVLLASNMAQNILVLDALEHVAAPDFPSISALVRALLSEDDQIETSWRVIIVSQVQGWTDFVSSQPIGDPHKVLEISILTENEVRAALGTSTSLNWLAAHDDAVAVLRNLRTLAWVMQAGSVLGTDATDLGSLVGIADRLWRYWTEDRADLHGLLIRLAERDAAFERQVPIHELMPSDAAAYDKRPVQFPLRQTNRHQIEFEHDLAADWARFQRLKASSKDLPMWSAYAVNPNWANAIRLLGQFLLRQNKGATTEWDDAFLQLDNTDTRVAADLLLDAMVLDTRVEEFLTSHSALLFADHGNRLSRLLIRFHQIATVPSALPAALADKSIGLYIEARFRTPVIERWLPIARFLELHENEISALAVYWVSRICEVWLTTTPPTLEGGGLVPFRASLARLALANAITVQVQKAEGIIYLARDESSNFFSAPLAGATDLPDEVCQWALEMAGRRPIAQQTVQRITDARRRRAAERAARIASDPALQQAEKERRKMPVTITGRHSLPPWPLGAERKIDSDFRKACIENNGLIPMMKCRPTIAAEILLALLIDDQPEEDYGSSRLEIELGLSHQHTYPTAFWKSPFFSFLQIAPDTAIDALTTLTNFCTERWQQQVMEGRTGEPPGISLQFDGGRTQFYPGNHLVFDWPQTNSLGDGQLFSALSALERWLTHQIEQGLDITKHVETLFSTARSNAILGVLVNVAKFKPDLIAGPLKPLLTNQTIFAWDDYRIEAARHHFDGMAWSRDGNAIFNAARDWTLAPYRQRTLADAAIHVAKSNALLSAQLGEIVSQWTAPDDPKLALEFRILCASLDPTNYQPTVEPKTGQIEYSINYPASLQSDINAYNESIAGPIQQYSLAEQCEGFIAKGASLDAENAEKLWSFLDKTANDPAIEDELKRTNLSAMAATLVCCALPWLQANSTELETVLAIVRHEVDAIPTTASALHRSAAGLGRRTVSFATHATFHLWRTRPEIEWERALLTFISSGDDSAVRIIAQLSYLYRDELGTKWPRVMQLGLLWSALTMLRPSYDNLPEVTITWERWLTRFRKLRVSGIGGSWNALNIARTSKGVERLGHARAIRTYEKSDKKWHGRPKRSYSRGLDTHILAVLFSWLVYRSLLPPGTVSAEERALLFQLWTHEVSLLDARKKEDGEYSTSSKLGYKLLERLADLLLIEKPKDVRLAWMPVLSLGPKAHHSLDTFIEYFLILASKSEADHFYAVWRDMLEFAMRAEWRKQRYWYYGEQALRLLLGFGHEQAIASLPGGRGIAPLRDIFVAWATTHLTTDEDNITGFAYFLTNKIGKPLRLEGLVWINEALKLDRHEPWYRDRTGEALVALLDKSLAENADQLRTDKNALAALMSINARLMAKNTSIAFALQERMKVLQH